MYGIISQVFLALFVIAYLAFLASLAWRAFGGRLRSALKNNVASVEREGQAVLGLFSRNEKNSVRDTYHDQLQSMSFGPLKGLAADPQESAGFLLTSNHEEFWSHGSVESNGDAGSSVR